MARKVTYTPRRFLPRIWDLRNYDVAPDGRTLAYGVRRKDQWAVLVRDLRTGREHPAMRTVESVGNPEFSPDGKWLAFQSDFEGDENHDIFVVPTKGGPARRLTDDPMDDASPRWSPDGTRIAFVSNRSGDRENVFVVDARGGEARQLTFEEDIVSDIAWRPDGQAIAFVVGTGNRDWIGQVDLAGRSESLVAFPDAEAGFTADYGSAEPWSPDGKALAFVSSVRDRQDIGVLDLATGEVAWIVQGRHDASRPVWSPDGARVAFLENRDGNIRLHTIRRDGRGRRPVSPAEGVANRAAWHPDGRGLFYQHSTALRPARLLFVRGARPAVVVDAARTTLPNPEFAAPRLVRYPSSDGTMIPAWLYVPPKSRARKAGIVVPHGGPESQTLNEWDSGDFAPQFLAAEGFTVLYPNYRGGIGYGRAWRRAADRRLGDLDAQDTIAGGRWLLEKGLVPAGRLGVLGTSHGGYLTAHCLEQAPDLWAVGVSIVGYFNWLTETTTERGNLQKYDRWKMGDPATPEGVALFEKLSPIHYLDRIRAPTLFTSGGHDPRCPPTEARAMVEAMRRAGKTVDHLEFPDEGHWPRRRANEIRLYERAIAWLKRFLPDEAPRGRSSRH